MPVTTDISTSAGGGGGGGVCGVWGAGGGGRGAVPVRVYQACLYWTVGKHKTKG